MGRNNESTSLDYKSLAYEYLYTYYDKSIIDYLKTITKMFDVDIEDYLGFFACLDKVNKDGILEAIAIVVPKPKDLKSSQIFIHEYKHGIDLYPYIGKYIGKKIDDELIDYEKNARTEEKVFGEYLVKKLSNKNIKH
jgi:hypothetical protein